MQSALRSTLPHRADTVAAPGRVLVACLPTVSRILLGLIFFVFGTCGLLNLLPPPPPTVPEGAMAFGVAMMKTGYLFQLVKGTEAVVGLLLLANRFVPLALTVLAPVMVNIISFHLLLEPSGLAVPLVALALAVHLTWTHRSAYQGLLSARTIPAVA
jgi:hypothetical protein